MPEPVFVCVVHVRGRVQGVGFRWWARDRLLRLGLTGSARNLDDGTVEIVARGDPVAIEALIAAIRGPHAPGRVESVEVTRSGHRAYPAQMPSPESEPPSEHVSEHVPLPPTVRLETGHGGLPLVRVTGRAGSAEIYLHGAHVTAWAPAAADPVLWMSGSSRYVPDAPLRGGVPICFPWFGAHGTDPSAPAHGFARLLDWELTEAREDGDDVVCTFRLTDTPHTRTSPWPHRFEARYTVRVGAQLTLALEVTNLDAGDVTFEEALHTYLRVGDITAVHVRGLEGAPFLDRLGGPDRVPGETGPVRFAGETDRIYLGTRASASMVDDGPTRRSVTIDKDGSDATVVWNPWVGKAAAMADFGDAEWQTMLCIETCNLSDAAVRLAPGQSHTMSAVLTERSSATHE